ncbi:hypothetical protein PVAND_016524 [Polypedilum vanderplanki]|uniref:Peptidase C1A papain C-terminal domain-containing protein n=1 Tax=Polypedilum vanderplanki TaxID=319348 RepID=A0A9J6BFD2_POLVA|nr:hypothetical protein PVAND_016524 [Polypedilum vanderplanki]
MVVLVEAWMLHLKFIKKFGKIAPCSDYPYEGNDTYKCKKLDGIVTVSSHENLTPGDENLLKKKLIEIGPIPIAVDASLSSFQTYKSGVYFDKQCTTNSNHAMLIVLDMKKKTELKYWLIKNTYGKSWGLQGYMKLARDVDNHCGVAEYASYPIV